MLKDHLWSSLENMEKTYILSLIVDFHQQEVTNGCLVDVKIKNNYLQISLKKPMLNFMEDIKI